MQFIEMKEKVDEMTLQFEVLTLNVNKMILESGYKGNDTCSRSNVARNRGITTWDHEIDD